MEELELVQKNGENGRFVSEMGRDSLSAPEETTIRPRNQNGARRNPPARNTSRFWFERFLSVIQRQNPTVIDTSFLSQVAPNNEGKLLAQLKFLHVIDEEGRPTELLSMLNMVGAEQKKGFQRMIRESYGELTSEIVIEKAVPDDLVNFFIRHYAFTRDKAISAAKFFIYLAERGSVTVSPELSSLLTEKGANVVTPQTSATGTTTTPSLLNSVVQRVGNERALGRSLREARTYSTNAQRKSRRDLESAQPRTIQTLINITLDKDTPQEYWDRVLALIGENKSGVDQLVASESQVTSSSSSSLQASNDN
jgi:hypothetical protein